MTDLHHSTFRRNPPGHIDAPLFIRMAARDVLRASNNAVAFPTESTRLQAKEAHKKHREMVRSNTRRVK